MNFVIIMKVGNLILKIYVHIPTLWVSTVMILVVKGY